MTKLILYFTVLPQLKYVIVYQEIENYYSVFRLNLFYLFLSCFEWIKAGIRILIHQNRNQIS